MSHSVSLTCKARFSASHFYRVAEWSEEKNREAFGKSANPSGHGHNFLVEVTAAGPVDPKTGMVVNIADLKKIVRDVLEDLDHKNLNKDIEFFKETLPTPENVAGYLYEKISKRVAFGKITRVRLHEDDTLYAEAFDSGVSITRAYQFSSAHRLHSEEFSPEENGRLYGKCANPNGHGHDYTLQISAATGTAPDRLDRMVREKILDPWDHHNFNEDVPEFCGKISTGETIVKMIWEKLSGPLGGKLEKVTLGETPDSFFEYQGV